MSEIEQRAGVRLFQNPVDNRHQVRGFDLKKFEAEPDWEPNPNNPEEVHPAIAREQARLKTIAAAEKALNRQVKAVPVGLAARALEASVIVQETDDSSVTNLLDYAQHRDAVQAA